MDDKSGEYPQAGGMLRCKTGANSPRETCSHRKLAQRGQLVGRMEYMGLQM